MGKNALNWSLGGIRSAADGRGSFKTNKRLKLPAGEHRDGRDGQEF